MNTTVENISSTKTKLTLKADAKDIQPSLDAAVAELGSGLKVPGFRPGKAPADKLRSAIDQNLLQQRVLEMAVPKLSVEAIEANQLRPSVQPEVAVTKFVPFDSAELEITVEHLGEIKLCDWKKISLKKPDVTVTKEEIDSVIDRIKSDMTVYKEAKRSAKNNDRVVIDFDGVDNQGKAIDGASGKSYPLVLGSQSFIPGFEDEVIGLKAGSDKTFDITFPKDYPAKGLAGSKVKFTISVIKVEAPESPKVDDELAAKVGPYKTIDDLKQDIEKHTKADKIYRAEAELENQAIAKIVAKSHLEIPEALLEAQKQMLTQDRDQNLASRQMDLEAWLKQQGVSQEQHQKEIDDEAYRRTAGGVVLSKIAEQEKIDVTPQEIDQTLENYQQQYQSDPQMSAELAKPEARDDIAARLLTQKTLEHIRKQVIKS